MINHRYYDLLKISSILSYVFYVQSYVFNILDLLKAINVSNYGVFLKINELVPCRISLGLTVSSSTRSPSHGRSRQDNLQVLFIRNGALI